MIQYFHPADTAWAKKWAIWSKTIIPTSILGDMTDASKPYFVTKDVGTGIQLVGEFDTWAQAEARYIAICNHSDADDYLGGSGRADVAAINIGTHRVKNGVVKSL